MEGFASPGDGVAMVEVAGESFMGANLAPEAEASLLRDDMVRIDRACVAVSVSGRQGGGGGGCSAWVMSIRDVRYANTICSARQFGAAGWLRLRAVLGRPGRNVVVVVVYIISG
jgi:hypothetical protein